MSIQAQPGGRITHLAVGRHLSYQTVRARLTLMYGGLFLFSGAALMAIAYLLLVNAGFVFTVQSIARNQPANGRLSGLVGQIQPGDFPAPGARTHPSAQTMAYWRGVAQCMRGHGISRFPEPSSSIPLHRSGIGVLSDRNDAILAFPSTLNLQAPAFQEAASACGYSYDSSAQAAQADVRHTHTRRQLLIQAGIALAAMSLLSLGLGWLMAGRVLQPLEDSYQAQRRFVANASHELRAPLTRLRALSEVALASPEANAASLRRAHERVLASEQHLERLIDGLLALARGQAGLEQREHLDLAALTSQALLTHDSQLADLDLDIRATLEPAPVAGDPRLLERLIANLIDNAIHHNVRGGHVEIATGTRDRHPFLSIANSGRTIPPEEIGRLFQPFQGLSAERTGHNTGHGLGLSIVQAITGAHLGELAAHARPEGGLTVEIAFPPAIGGGSRLRFTTSRTKRGVPPAISETDLRAGG